MAIDLDVSCPELPKIPELPSVNVLGLAELKGFLDFSQGSPRDCTVSINLMAQIAPLLASMTCLLKILGVVQALKGTVESGFVKTGELLDAIGDLAPCFGALTPASIAVTIKGILELVISFFLCFIEQMESLVRFQASIDLSAAAGNPALEASLECAQDNARASMDNLMASLESIQPLMDMTKSVGGVAGIDLELPDLSGVSVEEGAEETIADLREAVESLQQVIEGLPL